MPQQHNPSHSSSSHSNDPQDKPGTSSHGGHTTDTPDTPPHPDTTHGHTGSGHGGHTTHPPTSGGHKPPAPKPVPTPTPVPASGTIPIFNFGKNGATLATNPHLAGTELGYAWSDLEPTQGQFNWSLIDNDMAPWVAAGKKVIIRVSASGWVAWDAHPNKSWTPQWVYQMGVQSITDSDGAIKPQYWNPTFQQALSDFVAAFAARYDDKTKYPNIIAIEAGVGDGGETKPDTRKDLKLAAWQGMGYTDQVWYDTITKIIDMYKAAFKTTPIAIMPDNSFIGGTSGFNEHKVVAYAVSKGCWLQHNGIIAGIKRDPTWTTTIIGEQRLRLAQSGDTLAQDLQLMIDFGCSYAMCFEQDLANSANQATLAKYAAVVQH